MIICVKGSYYRSNPVRLVDMPKIKEKAIIQLDPDEDSQSSGLYRKLRKSAYRK